MQLPFLQRSLQDFRLVPLVVGQADKTEVAKLLETLWGSEETLIAITTDLSHFYEYAQAQQIDSHTADKILHLQDDLQGNEACGCRPLNGLLYLAG